MLNTIQIVQVRARDVPDAAIIRTSKTGTGWWFVYNVATDEDTADTLDVQEVFAKDIDDRYVILRISDDPAPKLIKARPNSLPGYRHRRSDEEHERLVAVRDLGNGELGDERPDRYVIMPEYDLVDMQVVVGLNNWTDDQA